MADSFDVDNLLNELFKPSSPPAKTLKELFNDRVRQLQITPTNVLDILKIPYRTLNGILNGSQKVVDFTNLIKIADFLQIPREQVIQLYLGELEKNFPNETKSSAKTIEFIKDNFDLVALKKAGFIKSINDYEQIESNIKKFFGLKSIFDYKKPKGDVALSAGLVKPRNDLSRSMWIKAASSVFEELNNPYEFNRKMLIEYFPEIRWHSMSVEYGLQNIIKGLFKIGVTVIYQSSLPSLHLRGATFSVNDKPCIVITDYKGFYPTLWFALIHELFHVLFDWEEIKNNSYHLSDKDNEQLSVIEKEKEANNFAREYLFSKEKLNTVRSHLFNSEFVREFAETNHVHPSFVYVFNAYELGDSHSWSKAKKLNPDIENLKAPLENPWDNPMSIPDFANSIRHNYYS